MIIQNKVELFYFVLEISIHNHTIIHKIMEVGRVFQSPDLGVSIRNEEINVYGLILSILEFHSPSSGGLKWVDELIMKGPRAEFLGSSSWYKPASRTWQQCSFLVF